MASVGAPDSQTLNGEGYTIAIVSTLWNEKIVERLRDRATTTAREMGAKYAEYTVAGALELPVVVQACAQRYDAVVALGCVIRGETAHFSTCVTR